MFVLSCFTFRESRDPSSWFQRKKDFLSRHDFAKHVLKNIVSTLTMKAGCKMLRDVYHPGFLTNWATLIKKYHREILVSFPSLVFLWFCRYPCPPLFSVSFVIKDRFCDLCVRPWQEKWCCPPHPVTDLFETRPAALKKLLTNISTLQSCSRIFRKSCKISGKVCNFEKYWTLRVILGVIDDQHDAILQFARLLAVYLWCD